jgi:hypothetical protein
MKRYALVLGIALALVLLPGMRSSVVRADGVYFYAVGGGAGPCEAAPHPTTFNDMGIPEMGICYGGPNGEHFAFSAHLAAGSLPSAATGHAALWFVNDSGVRVATFRGPVTCLMSGGEGVAYITFGPVAASGTGATDVPPPPPPAVSPSPSSVQGQYLTFSVLDGTANGKGGDMFSPPSEDGYTNPPCPPGGASYLPNEPVNFGQIRVDPQGLVPCIAMTDNATYNDTSTCDVYFNDGSGWQLAS